MPSINSQHFLRVLVVITTLTFSTAALALKTGDPAPAFELPGPQGTVRLADFRGKIVYLDFWASWCAPCRQSMPWLNEMQSKYSEQGLRVVGIGVDDNIVDANAFLVAVPVRFTIGLDVTGKTPKAYEIIGMPTSILIDRAGKVLFQHRGFRKSNTAELEQKIKQALGDEQ